MFCPECRGEFRAGIVTCPTCEVALTDRLSERAPERLQEPGVSPYLVDLVGFVDEQEAKAARRQLREARITCELVTRDTPPPQEADASEPEGDLVYRDVAREGDEEDLGEEYWIRVPGNLARAAREVLALDTAVIEDTCPSCGKPLEGESACPRCGYHQQSE